ncbi:hydroxyisourate hydrolase [Spongisporangium articulatum]|uniref:5-hydroxyisourate hydrolase n=1 Tax=Spongisporangium articulatum TaxID=3362603 RepID=A0ABW8AJ09_9ACTN
MTSLSTHVLDAVTGTPARGMSVQLDGGEQGVTDDDGRYRFDTPPAPGPHRLSFATGDWFAAAGRECFYPEVVITFTAGEGHHHVPLLLSPFAYSTYRGS